MGKTLPRPKIGPAVAEMEKRFERTSDQLIPILQFMQEKLGYLPSPAMNAIADYLRIPASHVFGVATFYAQFRFTPLGKNKITICRGTACHVRGSGRILEELEDKLKIKAGETTDDMMFSLQTVACVGSCALAPVVVVNDKVYAKSTPKSVAALVDEIEGVKPAAESDKPRKEEKAEAPAGQKPRKAAKKKAAKKKPEKRKPAKKKTPKKKAVKAKPVKKKAAGKKTVKKKKAAKKKAPARAAAKKRAKAPTKKAAARKPKKKTVKKKAAARGSKPAGKAARKKPARSGKKR